MSDYFTEKRSTSYTTRNIDSANGVLLLNRDGQDANAIQIMKEFYSRKHLRNLSLLKRPAEILSQILFDSKAEPWHIHVNALANHVGWVYTHSIDVALMSLMMGEALNYCDKDLYNLGLGSFFHDLGKLVVPRAIIQKPGPLTDMETVFIRQHCELGAAALKPFDLPDACMDIILHHHERLDGSGYPHALKGDEISIDVRIVLTADVSDAIISYRPYKAPKSIEEAVRILKGDPSKYPSEIIPLLEEVLCA